MAAKSSQKRKRVARSGAAEKRPTKSIKTRLALEKSVLQAGQQHSGFHKLPAELHIEILSYLLHKDEHITLHATRDRRWRNEVKALQSLAKWQRMHDRDLNSDPAEDYVPYAKSGLLETLLVCHAFYFAGIEAFYGNTLHFENMSHLRRFIRDLDIDRRSCVRRVTLHLTWEDVTNATHLYADQAPVLSPVVQDATVLDDDVFASLPKLKGARITNHYCVHQVWEGNAPGPRSSAEMKEAFEKASKVTEAALKEIWSGSWRAVELAWDRRLEDCWGET